jgi:hypothetical protein
LTFVDSEMLQYSSVFTGKDIGSAVLRYLEEVSNYGVGLKY